MIYKTDTNNEFFTDERCFIIEIFNQKEVERLSIARARVEPGVTTELHKLSVDEFYYILEGQGFVEIDNGAKKPVQQGDVVYIKSGLSQRITNTVLVDLVFLCICSPRFDVVAYTKLEK